MKTSRDHAILSPSSSEYWFKCQARVFFDAMGNSPDVPSEASKRGTLVHEILSIKLNKYYNDKEINKEELSALVNNIKAKDLSTDLSSMVKYLNVIKEKFPKEFVKYVGIESKNKVSELCYGTCDLYIVTKNDDLYVIDYKNGISDVKVNYNTQLGIYALSILKTKKYQTIKNIYLCIAQPRTKHNIIETALIKKEELNNIKNKIQQVEKIYNILISEFTTLSKDQNMNFSTLLIKNEKFKSIVLKYINFNACRFCRHKNLCSTIF